MNIILLGVGTGKIYAQWTNKHILGKVCGLLSTIILYTINSIIIIPN